MFFSFLLTVCPDFFRKCLQDKLQISPSIAVSESVDENQNLSTWSQMQKYRYEKIRVRRYYWVGALILATLRNDCMHES